MSRQAFAPPDRATSVTGASQPVDATRGDAGAVAVSAMPRRLNLGCGRDYRPGWWNVDVSEGVKRDQGFDAFAFPWPLPAAHFEEAFLRHIVEHVPHRLDASGRDGFFLFFEELHRVLAPGARVEVHVPWPEHRNAWVDPSHARALWPESFDYLDPEHERAYYGRARFRREEARVTRVFKWNWHLRKYLGVEVPNVGRREELHLVLRRL